MITGRSIQREWYYYYATEGGKTVFLGPYATEQEAYDLGFQRQTADFEVMKFPTRDKRVATNMLKARKYERGDNINECLRKIKHQ